MQRVGGGARSKTPPLPSPARRRVHAAAPPTAGAGGSTQTYSPKGVRLAAAPPTAGAAAVIAGSKSTSESPSVPQESGLSSGANQSPSSRAPAEALRSQRRRVGVPPLVW